MSNTQTDWISRWFLLAVGAAALLYAAMGWTPSSYGFALTLLGAPEQGPVLGSARPLRSDEWAVNTAMMQAAVNNRFQRFNRTSFYDEDLRDFWGAPLLDWSLAFKPAFWAFFAIDPAYACSLYFALLMGAMLAGYHLLFREIGASGWLAASASLLVFFSTCTQCYGWWALATVPWLLLVLLKPMKAWKKGVLLAWLLAATFLTFPYPPALIVLSWTAAALLLAMRGSWFGSRAGRVQVGVAVGAALVAAGATWIYYGASITAMSHTVYPGRRISAAGEVPGAVWASQFLPFLTLKLASFDNLIGENAVEISAFGSFFPLLTICCLRFREAWRDRSLRRQLGWLLGGALFLSLWQLAPLPAWAGKVTLMDRVPGQRALYGSGLLTIAACVLVWAKGYVSAQWLRLAGFVAAVSAGFVLKLWLFRLPLGDCHYDLALSLLLGLSAGASLLLAAEARLPVVLAGVALVNLLAFGRFNPLQPAEPIFHPPDTKTMERLRASAEAAGGVLIAPGFPGAMLNGLGFRSVSHIQVTPHLALWRGYFPAMDPAYFNLVFNRFAHIYVTADALPNSPRNDVIRVPAEVFEPVRNLRRALPGGSGLAPCQTLRAGAVEKEYAEGGAWMVEGWAPWKGESDGQGLTLAGSPAMRGMALETVTRPDIAERRADYNFCKAGFRLRLPLEAGGGRTKLSLIANGTAQGEVLLAGSECGSAK